MMKHDSEGVEDQLDRLNFALHEMLHSVRCETPSHHRSPSRLSIPPDGLWNEDSFSDHYNPIEIQTLHERIELLLQENDRLQMRIEDYLSSDQTPHAFLSISQSELDKTIETLTSLKHTPSQKLSFLSHTFLLKLNHDYLPHDHSKPEQDRIQRLEKELEDLRKTESSSNLSNSVDNEETCPTCGIDATKLRKEIKIELNAEFLKIKAEAIDRERAKMESQFEELDELKSSYTKKNQELQSKSRSIEKRKVELEKKEFEFAARKSQFEKKKHEWEHRVMDFKQELPPSEENFSPTKLSQQELETQLKELKEKIQIDPSSKLEMRINQIENHLTKLRTEKLLSECSKKNSKVVTNLVKAFDKETTQDENKRKKMLNRTQMMYSEVTGKRETGADKKWEMIVQREKELNEKEKYLQDTWKKVPNAEELINVIQTTYSHLNLCREENQKQGLVVEKEKSNLKVVLEKVLQCVESLEKNKSCSRETLEKIKEYLMG